MKRNEASEQMKQRGEKKDKEEIVAERGARRAEHGCSACNGGRMSANHFEGAHGAGDESSQWHCCNRSLAHHKSPVLLHSACQLRAIII
jgi:hypothetical protein